MFRGRLLRKVTDKPEELKYACGKALELAGVEVKELGDVIKFKEWVKYRCEKLDDYINTKKEENKTDEKKSYTLDYAIKIMNFYEPGHDVLRMKLSYFISCHNAAIEKVKTQKEPNQNTEEQ
jgi:hypothetical protein